MAWHVFLKSLRSQEGKILMPKFLLNLLLQISKALVNSKIQFLIQKFLFPYFWPADLAAHAASGPASPLASLPPQAETDPAGPPPAHASVASSREIRFPFWFTPSELAASPSSLCQPGPGCQLHPPPPVARAHLRCHRSPAIERRPAPRLRCHWTVTTSPSFSLP
jgi:hypothetical protein